MEIKKLVRGFTRERAGNDRAFSFSVSMIY